MLESALLLTLIIIKKSMRHASCRVPTAGCVPFLTNPTPDLKAPLLKGTNLSQGLSLGGQAVPPRIPNTGSLPFLAPTLSPGRVKCQPGPPLSCLTPAPDPREGETVARPTGQGREGLCMGRGAYPLSEDLHSRRKPA